MRVVFGALFLASLLSKACHVEAARQNTMILQRSADDGSITANLNKTLFTDATEEPCVFDGGELVFSHPMDLNPSDRFFAICNLFQKGYELMVDYINSAPRCGIKVQGKNYGVVLRSYAEDTSKEKAEAIALAAEPTTDFFLAPYTSSISEGVSKVANESNKVMIAPGSYFTSVYKDRPASFGVLPLPELYLLQVIPMLAGAGAKTIHTVYEGGPGRQCESIGPVAEANGMIIQGQSKFDRDPTMEDFLPLAKNMSMPDADPDVVITCTYDAACKEWIYALREVNWSPRAQVFSICIGLETFREAVGTDAEFLTGMSPWDKSLEIKDSISGWTPEEFVEAFETYSGRDAAYHSALGQASVSLLAQAIEFADSLVTADVANALQTQVFETVFGRVVFDENGQNNMNLIATQYDGNSSVNVVYPPEVATGEFVYPMPTWAKRDCIKLSECGREESAYSGICDDDGTCICSNENDFSFGIGPTAACHSIPQEDYTYISPALKILGFVFVGIQGLISLFFTAWALYYKDRSAVRLSQPIFLIMVAVGCFIMTLGIIPLSIEGEYRYEQDPETGKETDVSADGVRGLDAACMAFPWLLVLGFSITFSALFAKITRIRKVMQNAASFRRVQVTAKDVASIMIVTIAVECVILLTWQFVAPLQWSRTVVAESDLGYPTKSVGECVSDNDSASTAFTTILCVVNFGLLAAALWLCYVSRNFDSNLSEGKWITASVISILQVLLLAIPVTIIASEDTSASFFVKSAATFVTSLAVSCFIFIPKWYNLHVTKEGGQININCIANRTSTMKGRDSKFSQSGQFSGTFKSIDAAASVRISELKSLDENKSSEFMGSSEIMTEKEGPRESVSQVLESTIEETDGHEEVEGKNDDTDKVVNC